MTEVIQTEVIQINAEDLSKSYGQVEALKDVSFSAESSGILGILGPNGAGKTTLLKILTCYHPPSQGQAEICGLSVLEDSRRVKEIVGYLPENNPLYNEMTPEEYLNFIAEAHLIRSSAKKYAVEYAITVCGLKPYHDKRIETLSKGYRQRTGLAAALVHDPPVIILDEPNNGLDPNQIVEMRKLIRELGKKKLVILSTHILHEAENLCEKIIILYEGKIQAQGTTGEIAKSLGMTEDKPDLEKMFIKLTNRQSEEK